LLSISTATLHGQGLKQFAELGLAFVLSSLIGVEREWRHKSAGLRTHALVGTGAALFVLVSKYGFTDVLGSHVILDPSRVAAQVVTAGHFVVVFVYPRLAAALPRSRYLSFRIRVVYEDGRGILRQVLTQSTALGFAISRVDTRHLAVCRAGTTVDWILVLARPASG
jgi:putative Mg2+ transporter-C (MgtC) family protein